MGFYIVSFKQIHSQGISQPKVTYKRHLQGKEYGDQKIIVNMS